MATKKDLVEAYSFSRRRLVTAFVSGAPGGREVEPARPGRTIVGGLALAVLLIAGAAIAGIFSPKVPDDWTDPGLIVSKEDGTAYVITEDENADEDAPPILRPVINSTSAKLILGAETTPRIVPQAAIDGQQVGEPIGILGAPPTVPSTSQLVDTGWTACTDRGDGIRVTIADEPGADPVQNGAFLVSNDDDYYVIAVSGEDEASRAYSYRLPSDDGARDNMLSGVGLDMGTTVENATEVSQTWLGLFPEGLALDSSSFGLEDEGQPAPGAGDNGIPTKAVVGDILSIGAEHLLLTADGATRLTDFAYAVYKNLPAPHHPTELTLTEPPDVGREEPPYSGSHWPASLPDTIAEPPCAVLLPEAGKAPRVLPGRLTSEPASVPTASAGVDADEQSQGVQRGRGAYVLSGDWEDTTQGTPFLIDSKGKSYTLVGPNAPGQLGYADYQPPIVPDRWVELFSPGVPLSRDAALCEPTLDPGATC
jgi:type VII secretion protein EccB